MIAPTCIVEAVAELVKRRDALNVLIEDLTRVYALGVSLPSPVAAPPKRATVKRSAKRAPASQGDDIGAAVRRDLLLAAIGKAEMGLTMADLRKATPKMDGKDRSNALQALKAAGTIRRVGNTWQRAKAAA